MTTNGEQYREALGYYTRGRDEEMLSAYVTGRMMRDGLMRTEAEQEFRCGLARVRRDAWQAGHTTGFEDALLACEIATGVKPGPPPGPTPNPHEETP